MFKDSGRSLQSDTYRRITGGNDDASDAGTT